MSRLNPKRLLAAAYLAALALWLVQGAGALVQRAWYTGRGLAPSVCLTAEQLELYSLRPYVFDHEPVEGMWISSDSDPQIHWNQYAWVDTVILDVRQECPAGSVELYYKQPGQRDFDTRQVVYPKRDAQGRYVFELGGKWIDRLRVDPDSVGGVPTELRALQINPPGGWYRNFIPSAGQTLVLLVLPLVLSALLLELGQLLELGPWSKKVHRKAGQRAAKKKAGRPAHSGKKSKTKE